MNFLVRAVPSVVAALVAYAIFILINCFGIEEAAKI